MSAPVPSAPRHLAGDWSNKTALVVGARAADLLQLANFNHFRRVDAVDAVAANVVAILATARDSGLARDRVHVWQSCGQGLRPADGFYAPPVGEYDFIDVAPAVSAEDVHVTLRRGAAYGREAWRQILPDAHWRARPYALRWDRHGDGSYHATPRLACAARRALFDDLAAALRPGGALRVRLELVDDAAPHDASGSPPAVDLVSGLGQHEVPRRHLRLFLADLEAAGLAVDVDGDGGAEVRGGAGALTVVARKADGLIPRFRADAAEEEGAQSTGAEEGACFEELPVPMPAYARAAPVAAGGPTTVALCFRGAVARKTAKSYRDEAPLSGLAAPFVDVAKTAAFVRRHVVDANPSLGFSAFFHCWHPELEATLREVLAPPPGGGRCEENGPLEPEFRRRGGGAWPVLSYTYSLRACLALAAAAGPFDFFVGLRFDMVLWRDLAPLPALVSAGALRVDGQPTPEPGGAGAGAGAGALYVDAQLEPPGGGDAVWAGPWAAAERLAAAIDEGSVENHTHRVSPASAVSGVYGPHHCIAAWLGEAFPGPDYRLLPIKAYRLDMELLRLVDDLIPEPADAGSASCREMPAS